MTDLCGFAVCRQPAWLRLPIQSLYQEITSRFPETPCVAATAAMDRKITGPGKPFKHWDVLRWPPVNEDILHLFLRKTPGIFFEIG